VAADGQLSTALGEGSARPVPTPSTAESDDPTVAVGMGAVPAQGILEDPLQG